MTASNFTAHKLGSGRNCRIIWSDLSPHAMRLAPTRRVRCHPGRCLMLPDTQQRDDRHHADTDLAVSFSQLPWQTATVMSPVLAEDWHEEGADAVQAGGGLDEIFHDVAHPTGCCGCPCRSHVA
jgi:hypothetical protein